MDISLNDSLNIYLKLFEYIDYLSYTNEIIFIKYNVFKNELKSLFFNYKNVVFYQEKINYKNVKKINIRCLENNSDLLIELKKIFQIPDLYQKPIIYRNINQENILYNYFIKNINEKYVLFLNKEDTKIIHYFNNDYIFNPFQNFYESHHPFYDKWVKLFIDNFTYLFKIIEHALEIHVYGEDYLFLILEANIYHIKKKYFYCSNREIRKHDERLKEWNIVQI